jgi:hypothetical protein
VGTAAVRRRIVGLAVTPLYPTSLRDEGRYAALVGDRAGAIRACRPLSHIAQRC